MMRKSSKVLSLLLAVLMAVSCFSGLGIFTASAADTTKIYFEFPDLEAWGTPQKVFCHTYHVYGPDGASYNGKGANWGLKIEQCTLDTETGLYSYDIDAKLGSALMDGNDYAVIFMARESNGTTHQTGNVTLTSECYGGTIYVTGNMTENTEDSSKMDYEGTWKEPELAKKYGPKAAITSTGKVIGSFFPVYQPKEEIVAQAIRAWAVKNASLYTPEVVQAICADSRLQVEPQDVYDAYATMYAAELADPATYTETASLETVATLLGISSEEPTTEEPTTEEPTTEEPAPTAVYTVAGDAGLTGAGWDPSQNVMTAGTYTFDGKDYDYAITLENATAGSWGFKVTDGTWNNSWGKDGGNYPVILSKDCAVTIYFNSNTTEIAVESEGLSVFKLDTITAVGNGFEGSGWLNDISWNPAAAENDMTEVAPGIWEITFENVVAEDYQVKFACNHSWQPYNWTLDGVLDGQTNPIIEVTEDGSTVILKLDVTGFDFTAGTGTVVPSYQVIPPTSEEPTTEEPTTEPPTEEPTTEPQPVGTFFTVAGDAGLTGAGWDPSQNEMTAGTYTFEGKNYDYAITLENATAGSWGFKVTDGTWNNSWGKDGGNYPVILSKDCAVTIYFNSYTTEIAVESEGLSAFKLETITAVGNGFEGSGWLNDKYWLTDASENDMTEVAPGIWEITFENVVAEDYQVKFACNHSWQPYNWTLDGVLDGQTNPIIEVTEDGSTVTLRLDVREFDFTTGTGSVTAEYTVTPPQPAGPIYGDADGDGKITINDATMIQRACVKLAEVDETICDVNGDGVVNIHDVTYIQKYIVKGNYDTKNVGKTVVSA